MSLLKQNDIEPVRKPAQAHYSAAIELSMLGVLECSLRL
jgi:hypothetical protein